MSSTLAHTEPRGLPGGTSLAAWLAMVRPPPPPRPLPWQPLLHRWFVEYNPIYLISAMLVLGGMQAISRGLAHDGSLYGLLGVALIAEIYACALIGGAALLTRLGQRRPAVMLGLITVLYQSDLTLHTETCALLGGVGVLASAAWLTLFVVKLVALGWALRIRIAPRALATASFGALGLTVAPYVLGKTSAATAGALVALFVFGLGSLLTHDQESATSLVPVDPWSRTVLRRSTRAAWIMWGALLAVHILFWSLHHTIALEMIVPALALLATQRLKRESHAWMATVSLLAAVFVAMPVALSMCALLAAVALARRAFTRIPDGNGTKRAAPVDERSPYRARGGLAERADGEVTATHSRDSGAPALALVPLDDAARARLLSGSVFATHLALWTLGWTGGALPAHVLWLDAALFLGIALVAWRLRAPMVLLPFGAACLHGVFASGLVPPPRSLLEWGALTVVLGFVLLGASLVVSTRLRHVAQPDDPPAPLPPGRGS